MYIITKLGGGDMYCQKCGAEQLNESKFCHKCGNRIINENQERGIINEMKINSVANNYNNGNCKINDTKLNRNNPLIGAIVIGGIIVIGALLFLFQDNIKSFVTKDKPASTAKTKDELVKTDSNSKTTDEEQLKAVIALNAKALEDENFEKYNLTISIPASNINATKETLEKLFKDYDLRYLIESVEILSVSSDEAKVKVVQITTKLNGPAFKDNKVTAINYLKKISGKWKIYKTDLMNVEYLNVASLQQSNTAVSKSSNEDKGFWGKWTDGDSYNLILTDTTFNGQSYTIYNADENVLEIEVLEETGKCKYGLKLVEKDVMMVYLYNEVTNSFTGGSQLRRVD